ncbi:MAG TPA: hypothetical protein VKL99_06535 [Candidatus Angelobacter sp.]|nr:hypothetical protein [Candidatus Angelobacter sp.]
MIPFSSAITPIQLTWVKSKIKGRYELTASGPILGSLQRVGFWKSVAQAEFKGKTWSFQRSGIARTAILEEPGARPVAKFKANWLGGGTLVFNDGECFQLTAKGFCRPVWSWVNHQGMKLLEVVPHHKTVRVTGTPGTDAWNSAQSKLPVLIMFSWHQILQTNDDAAAVAAISAAAAG